MLLRSLPRKSRKKMARDECHTFAIYVDFVRDVIDFYWFSWIFFKNCPAQTSSSRCRFRDFKRRFLTNRTRNLVKNKNKKQKCCASVCYPIFVGRACGAVLFGSPLNLSQLPKLRLFKSNVTLRPQRLLGTGSSWRPPRLSHSSWALNSDCIR